MNKYYLSYRFLNGNVHGCVFAKNRTVSLNWSDYIKVCVCVGGGGGVRFADFISVFFLKYPMKMELFGLTETKLFHFHRIFKNGERGGGSSKTP